MTTCRICHKPRKDAISGKLGIGPVSRLNGKLDDAEPNLFKAQTHACYDYEVVDRVVCIVENDRGKSVTNDAENVIADLLNDGIDLSMPVRRAGASRRSLSARASRISRSIRWRLLLWAIPAWWP